MEGYDGGVDESSQLCWREVGQPEDGHDIHSQQVTQPNTIFPSPGQHKVGGPKCASATNKKSRILSVVCFVCQLLASYSVKKLYFCSCGKNARQKINKGVYGDSYFI